MKHVGDGLGVKNIFDLVLKGICGIYEKKKLTKEEIKNYKMTQREIYEKLNYIQRVANLFMLKIMSWQILLNTVEGKKKRGIRAIDGFRRKLMIPDFEITKCSEHEVKSKSGTIFLNKKILEEYSIKIYEIDPSFYEHYKKMIKRKVNTYYLELILIFLNIL